MNKEQKNFVNGLIQKQEDLWNWIFKTGLIKQTNEIVNGYQRVFEVKKENDEIVNEFLKLINKRLMVRII